MKTVLLDMDGVILHQPSIHRFVAIRATSFVRHSLKEKVPNMSFHHAETMNKHLYTTYGHTLTGLNKVFQVNKTIEEFNDYVYDDVTMNYVPNFKEDPLLTTRGKDVRKVIEKCKKNNIPIYIFSNAPIKWCKMMTKMMDLSIDSDKILGSDHLFFTEQQMLKPIPHLYHRIDDMIQHRFHQEHEIIFIDDSMINLFPSINMKNWKSVLLCPNTPCVDVEHFSVRQSILGVLDLV